MSLPSPLPPLTVEDCATFEGSTSRIKPYKCKLCDIGMREDSVLLHFNRLHHDGAPWKCSACGISYARKACLEKHVNRCPYATGTMGFHRELSSLPPLGLSDCCIVDTKHDSGEIYQCIVTGCSERTSSENVLLTHFKWHRFVTPWRCLYCQGSFARRACLEEHEISCTEVPGWFDAVEEVGGTLTDHPQQFSYQADGPDSGTELPLVSPELDAPNIPDIDKRSTEIVELHEQLTGTVGQDLTWSNQLEALRALLKSAKDSPVDNANGETFFKALHQCRRSFVVGAFKTMTILYKTTSPSRKLKAEEHNKWVETANFLLGFEAHWAPIVTKLGGPDIKDTKWLKELDLLRRNMEYQVLQLNDHIKETLEVFGMPDAFKAIDTQGTLVQLGDENWKK